MSENCQQIDQQYLKVETIKFTQWINVATLSAQHFTFNFTYWTSGMST